MKNLNNKRLNKKSSSALSLDKSTKEAKKQKTNEQLIRNLLKELNTIETALLRERLLTIAVSTKKSIKKDIKKWLNPIIHPTSYNILCDKIIKHLTY